MLDSLPPPRTWTMTAKLLTYQSWDQKSLLRVLNLVHLAFSEPEPKPFVSSHDYALESPKKLSPLLFTGLHHCPSPPAPPPSRGSDLISLRLKAIAQMKYTFQMRVIFSKPESWSHQSICLKHSSGCTLHCSFEKEKKNPYVVYKILYSLTHHHPLPHQFFILALFYLAKFPMFPLTTFIHSTHIIEHLQGPRQWLKV